MRSGTMAGLAACLAALAAPTSSFAEAARASCVPPAQVEALTCPGEARRLRVPAKSAPTSRVSTRSRPAARPEKTPPAPGLEEAPPGAAGSRAKVRARDRALLAKQIALARRLVAETRRGDPELPGRRLRLADLYEELMRSFRDEARALDEPIFAARRAGQGGRAAKLLAEQRRAETGLGRARDKAIAAYSAIAREHPDFARRDEAIFRQASMLEDQARDAEARGGSDGASTPRSRDLRRRARTAYHQLIKGHPTSDYVAHAYLAFAEHYFDEGQMPEALRFYEKVATYDGSPVQGYALYKSAWCHINLGRDRDAVSQLVRVLEHARAHPRSPMAGPLARQSRRELVPPFARAFPPSRAFAFFERVAGDHATEMMELLAQHYFDQGQWARASAAYHALMAQDPDGDRTCFYQTRAAECALRTAEPDDRLLELRRTADLMRAFVDADHPAAAEGECRAAVARLLLDVATSWHQEAVGTASSPGTGDAGTLSRALELYDLALSSLPNLDELALDGWAPEDRPTRYRVAYFRAEILWQQRDYERCGPAFDRVVDLDAEGEYSDDAAYASVLCYDRVYQARLAETDRELRASSASAGDDAPTPRRELTPLEAGMLRAFTRYLCAVPDGDESVRIAFRRASLLDGAGRFEEAAPLFARLVSDHPEHELAPFAAHRHLDALTSISRRDPAQEGACLDDLESTVERYVADERLMAHEEFPPTIHPRRAAVLWKRAEAHSAAGSHFRCAETYRRIYSDYRDRLDDIQGHGLDEVLYNQALCYEADYRIGPAISTRLELIQRYGEGTPYALESGRPSPLAQRALYQVGGNYHAIAAYTKAADFYETFARRHGGEEEAPRALQSATIFRLGLGQDDRALENSRLFEESYGRRGGGHEAEAATVVFSVGEVFLRREQWREAERHYADFLRRYRDTAGTDEVIGARVRLGHALWQQGERHRGRAARELEKVVAIADRGRRERESLEERLGRYRKMVRGLGESDAERAEDQTRRLVGMVSDIAKARFYLGEGAFARFGSIELPAFRASPRLSRAERAWWAEKIGRTEAREWEGLLRLLPPDERQKQIGHVQLAYWIHRSFQGWREEREAARVAAEELYARAAAEDVPEWEIAAAARVGDMHRVFVETLYSLPTPPAIRGDPELEAEWEAAVDGAAEPHRSDAIRAYDRCVVVATSSRWFNDWSRSCELALHRLSPREYPLSDELRAEPRYAHGPIAAPRLLETLEAEE